MCRRHPSSASPVCTNQPLRQVDHRDPFEDRAHQLPTLRQSANLLLRDASPVALLLVWNRLQLTKGVDPVRIQKRTRRPRARLSATALASIDAEIKKAARRFGVSRSFVIAVALADHFGIKDQEQYAPHTFTIYRVHHGKRRRA